MMALGNNIRFHRERLNWTLEHLSERSGVEVGTISALELRGSSRSKYAPAICKALGFTVEQLTDDSFDWRAAQQPIAWPFKLLSERKYRALSDQDKDRVETVLVAILHSLHIDATIDRPSDVTTGT